jgi:hypothetical protein
MPGSGPTSMPEQTPSNKPRQHVHRTPTPRTATLANPDPNPTLAAGPEALDDRTSPE